MTDSVATYFIRLSQDADFDRIVNFCEENRHPNVRSRDAQALRQRAQAGSVVLLEDGQGKIMGMMASYPLVSRDTDGTMHQKWTEIGSARIVLNGYPKLFDTMMALNILRAHLLEPPEQGMIGRVGNGAVQKRLLTMGWEEYTPPAEAVDLAARTKLQDAHAAAVAPTGDGAPPKWYRVIASRLPMIAQGLIEAIEQPVITHRDGAMKIRLDFSRAGFVRMFEPQIRQMANTEKPTSPGQSFGL